MGQMSALRVFGGRLVGVIITAVEESMLVAAACSCEEEEDGSRGGGSLKMDVSGSMLSGSVRRWHRAQGLVWVVAVGVD